MTLKEYINSEILPRYEGFDKAHGPDHAQAVISRSLQMAQIYGLDEDMVYAAAAYHDTGLCDGRERHHLVSGQIVREDMRLREWFGEEQIKEIAEAAEDHRASAGNEPRSILGRIIAEADRLIDADVTLRRTVQYGIEHYPELDREGQWERTLEHLGRKYAEGGYLKLLVPESDNAVKLREFRALIADRPRLRAAFDAIYDDLSGE